MSNYNDTSKLPVCDKHRHEVINHALREEVIPLTVGMKLEQTVETLRELLEAMKSLKQYCKVLEAQIKTLENDKEELFFQIRKLKENKEPK